jgi:osmotically-inducible protein OsmY
VSIAVKAADGVVTLSGSTKDPGLRSMAAQVALSVPGVRSVRNELTISADV